MLNFGERLRMAREHKGLTQLDVCKSINLSNKSLSRYETNASSPNPDIIRKLISLYDVSAYYILGMTDTIGSCNLNNKDINLTQDENLILLSFNKLSENEQKSIIQIIKQDELKNSFLNLQINNDDNVSNSLQNRPYSKHEKKLLDTYNQVDDVEKGRIIQFALEILKESMGQQAASIQADVI